MMGSFLMSLPTVWGWNWVAVGAITISSDDSVETFHPPGLPSVWIGSSEGWISLAKRYLGRWRSWSLLRLERRRDSCRLRNSFAGPGYERFNGPWIHPDQP